MTHLMEDSVGFKMYPQIEVANDLVAHKIRSHPDTLNVSWAVTEFIDGDHLAIYANHKHNEFKASARAKEINISSTTYSDAKDVIKMHRDWLMEFSRELGSAVTIYGKMVGGHYGTDTKRGIWISSACEYMPTNDYIIHDIKVPAGYIGLTELEQIGKKYLLTTVPVLFRGKFASANCYPEDNLSMVPFIKKLPVNYDNEMRGIVIRPIVDLYINNKLVIVKRMNRKYSATSAKPLTINETLIDIAQYMDAQAMLSNVFDAALVECGSWGKNDISRVAGKYVQILLDNVTYIKYSFLKKNEKNLVHKELNSIALQRLRKLIETAA